MNFSDVTVSYFSPTNTTKKICTTVAEEIAHELSVPVKHRPFTLPPQRKAALEFSSSSLVVFGVPVYAGRVPNFLNKYLATMKGNGAICVPIVLYGNRNYDDALLELCYICKNAGMMSIAAAAFIGEHSFSEILAANRPDGKDIEIAVRFARDVCKKLELPFSPVVPKGNFPYRPYMVPKTSDGGQKTITEVFPKVSDACVSCGTCASVCPMGCIADDFHSYVSFCVKCCTCVKACPTKARYYDDENYLFHKKQLEENYTRRAEPELFL